MAKKENTKLRSENKRLREKIRVLEMSLDDKIAMAVEKAVAQATIPLVDELATRRGRKRANVALAHTILIIIYFMVRDGVRYQDLSSDYFDKRNKVDVVKRSVRRIESLGFEVTVKPKEFEDGVIKAF